MSQCIEQSVKTGARCRRPAVTGADVCAGHGGIEKSITPYAIRQRNQRVKCKATIAGSKGQTPCGNYAVPGATVCRFHGGASPQVKRKARERLMDMIDPAVTHLQRIIEKDTTSDADRLRAIQMLLDRTGYGPKSEVTLEAKPWQQMVESGEVAVEIDPGPPIVDESVRDHSAALQAAHDQWAFDNTPDAPVIPMPDRSVRTVAAVMKVPTHLR